MPRDETPPKQLYLNCTGCWRQLQAIWTLSRAAEASRAARGMQVNMNSVERLVDYAGFALEAPPFIICS